ncbi:hypothetical protein DP144_10740 [Clostridium tetani]|uniref:DUF2577 family protein n=1 Tax=Clostridium tetani TaxID=1513 RepID=UPI00100AC390|nr:DUF2577 family protein [Clostridium tetani]RXM75131.1 hypothetical protein DP154_10185 [Clostridium tetani]RYU98491.1 hypothetical protein DP144_10740 [Clostridium tetani]
MQKEGAENNPPPVGVGVVLSSNPLKIKVSDLILYRENMLVNVDIKELNINDLVATISIEHDQRYIVLAKVV